MPVNPQCRLVELYREPGNETARVINGENHSYHVQVFTRLFSVTLR